MGSTLYDNIFFILGGVAILMFGMKIMGDNLEKLAGNNLRKLLGKMTNNKFAGVGVGAIVTAIINSSSATTVMLVGFVNVGLMTLAQATTVIMGANIGTTITAQILSFSNIGKLNITAIAALVATIGMGFDLFCKKDRLKKIGIIFLGLGMIFIGLEITGMSIEQIVYEDPSNKATILPFFRDVLQSNAFPLLLILIGLAVTGIIQSSAAVTGILIALGSAITFDNAIFIILGSNIGTCVTALISSVGTNSNARRTAIVHILFNTLGCIIFTIPLWIFKDHIEPIMETISFTTDPGRMIANFHTIFNVITTLILLPFTNILVKMAEKLVPDKKDQKKRVFSLDDRILQTPTIAANQIKTEIVKMAGLAKENLNLSLGILLDKKFDDENTLKENEETLNYLNGKITAFLTKIMAKDGLTNEEKRIGSYYHVVSDLERIGDYSENIMEYAFKLKDIDSELSTQAIDELKDIQSKLNDLMDKAMTAFENADRTLLDEINKIEESIDEISVNLEAKHIERLRQDECSPDVGSIFLQAISNLERIGDHITNVGFSILKY
ncbi:MAG: Na/Pi cotransporter family protein [Clostridiales bacterium]|nr:Na/Pi cotransporter family protein [Clostridiales bacterium]